MFLHRWCMCVSVGLFLALGVQQAGAGTLTLQWDPSPSGDVAGYVVFVGTSSGEYSSTIDVGNVNSFQFIDAVPGQDYYFAVSAYSHDATVGTRSAEISGRIASTLTLTSVDDQIGYVGESTTLQLSGSDTSGLQVWYNVFGLPPGLMFDEATGLIYGTPTTEGSYPVTVTVDNRIASTAVAFTWTIERRDTTSAEWWRLSYDYWRRRRGIQ